MSNLPDKQNALRAPGIGTGSFVQQVAPQTPRIAVLGTGLAGLISAYRLTQKGYHVDLYDAVGSAGGRVRSLENPFGEGGHFDLGGELIDAKHTGMIELCKELGIPLLDRHQAIPGDGLMIAGGKRYSDKDMFDPATGTGDAAALIAAIRADQQALRDDKGNWSERAHALDNLSLDQYLDQKIAETGTPAHVGDILKAAYTSEIGRETKDLSALNLIDFIGTDPKQDFSIFGDSDETYAVEGGTARIVQELMKRLDGKATFHFGKPLTAVASNGATKLLTFGSGEHAETVRSDFTISTLPLPRLAKVEGLEHLGLSPQQIETVKGAQYNHYTKIMVQMKGRPWKAIPDFNGEVTGAGTAFQSAWPSNDENLPEDRRPKNGTMTFLVGNAEGKSPAEIAAAAKRDYLAFLRMETKNDTLKESDVFTDQQAWVMQHGKSGGCLPAPQPGGYAPLVELGKSLADISGVGFAGAYMATPSEHGTWIGFMHNQQSAGRAVEKALADLPVIEQEKAARGASGATR